MAKGVKHYKRDGTEFTGATHKMPDGTLHSGKTHGKTSVKLFHFEDLSKTAKEKAMPGMMKPKAKAKSLPKRGQRTVTNKKKKKPMRPGGQRGY
jgi:hypothetical protein